VSTMSDWKSRYEEAKALDRTALNRMLADQERELPLESAEQRWRKAEEADEAERALRRQWRREQRAAGRQQTQLGQDQQGWVDFIDQRIAAALTAYAKGSEEAVGTVIAQIRQQLQDQQTRALNRMRADFAEKIGPLKGEIVGKLDLLAPRIDALARELQQRGAVMDARDFELQGAINKFRQAIERAHAHVQIRPAIQRPR
jgi:hypothetical protein